MPMHSWGRIAPRGSGSGPRQQVRALLVDAWEENPADYDLDELTANYIDELNQAMPAKVDVSPFGDIHVDGELTNAEHEAIGKAFTEVEGNFDKLLVRSA